jgi:hypothetical protein
MHQLKQLIVAVLPQFVLSFMNTPDVQLFLQHSTYGIWSLAERNRIKRESTSQFWM